MEKKMTHTTNVMKLLQTPQKRPNRTEVTVKTFVSCFLKTPKVLLSSSLSVHVPLSLSPVCRSVDKVHLTLTELCSCYSLCGDLTVFDHIVVPAEFLLSHLESRLSEYVAAFLRWAC